MARVVSGYRLGTVLAHPDDETFGTGGTLVRAVARGLEVHSLCLTKGEQGWDPASPIATRDTIGNVRADEMRAAGRLVGLKSVTVLDWGDGGMSGDRGLPKASARDVEDSILAWLREQRPDILITWGQDGGYLHPDHIAAGERCIAALARAGDALPKRVYRFVLSQRAFEKLRLLAPEWDLSSIARPWTDDRLGALVTLTDEELEKKWAAMRLHRSQAGDLRIYQRVWQTDRDALRYEAYLRYLPPQDGTLERDLF